MNLITVIPLTRSKVADTLSYFTSTAVPAGAIVTVPLRSKNIHGIVASSRPAQDLKSEIKRAPFEIRKLGRVRAVQFFPASFMESCRILSDYYATGIGAVINALVPDSLLENAGKIAAPAVIGTPTRDETYAVQGDDEDRLGSWRSLIRQEFARKKSLAFYVPTLEDARNLFASLEKGIEGYIYLIYGSLTKKKMAEVWMSVAKNEHPVVVIATGMLSLLPRSDIETVVIERENGRGWISQKAPYMDLRHALETIARRQRQMVYLSDMLLRSETLRRLDDNEISEGSPFKWRSISSARDELVDMREYKAAENAFRIVSPELEELIKQNQEENTHLFVLALRRGHSPTTVCDDCETIVVCKNCGAPVVLHTSSESGKNFFMCHKCGERRSADEACTKCGGWRLTPLGIGIDRVGAEIRERLPGVDIIKIDADATPTEKDVTAAVHRWRSKPGSVLLGTETALLHINEKVDHTAVASLDSLFALPDFRITEKIMYTLIRLRSLSVRSIVVQTRRPEEKVFEYGLKGNLSDFHRALMEERKRFSYPPFSTLVKITLEGKKDAIANSMAAIQKLVEPREIDIFPAFTSSSRGNSVIHGLIKMDSHLWPNTELVGKLRSLPPGVSVKVDPESLL